MSLSKSCLPLIIAFKYLLNWETPDGNQYLEKKGKVSPNAQFLYFVKKLLSSWCIVSKFNVTGRGEISKSKGLAYREELFLFQLPNFSESYIMKMICAYNIP